MYSGIFNLAIIISLAAILGILAKILKQPAILAYIASGILIGIFGNFHLIDKEIFGTFSDLGIMFLLFMIGLEINFGSLKLVGRTSMVVGTCQIAITSIMGFLLALTFHFGYLQSAYIAIALTFSSTIIAVKLLSEKKDLNSLYGKISIGFLLAQDFLAILILIFLAGMQNGKNLSFEDIIVTSIKGLILFGLTLFLGRKILPSVFDKIARSQELLFVASLAWCLGVASIVAKTGFSIEIGGFLAGLSLANTSESLQIASKVKPLRDFFVLMFFVILGSSLASFNFSGIIIPIIIFSLFVLIGKPLIIMAIMGFLGYKKRIGFLSGVTVAQISEFSLVLAVAGVKLGHLADKEASLITSIAIITITLSGYLITHNEELYRRMGKYLSIFEKRARKNTPWKEDIFDKPIILIGSHRVGQNIAANLLKEDLLVIDFDPDIVSRLRREGYTALFGDVADAEVFEKANIEKARLVISTSPQVEDNLRLMKEIESLGENKPKIIVRAENEEDARLFYKEGADYVIVPHLTSGQYLGKSVSIDPELKILERLKRSDLKAMENHEK
ncbi:MAG: cation:proton antiporter [Candidatus Wolfebacteria bacterium]|nr:cation:proton antiporter [Candidatus Wolfebacteria bacterium]